MCMSPHVLSTCNCVFVHVWKNACVCFVYMFMCILCLCICDQDYVRV